MVKCKCPICGEKLVDVPRVPSPLDDIRECPKCGCCHIGFLIPKELGECDVDCLCDGCGHKWSVHVVLPKNLFGEKWV